MKPYLIKWIDITEDGGWHTPEEFNEVLKGNKKDSIVTQVGFLYSQDSKLTVIVDSFVGHEDILYGVIHQIPTSCIIKLQELNNVV